jgi:hypothetical protein
MMGTVRITEPAMRVVLATSTEPASWDRPSDTVQFSRFSTRNSSANRNSFQAIMNTNRLVAMIAGMARGREILRMMVRRPAPSRAAASSRPSGIVAK